MTDRGDGSKRDLGASANATAAADPHRDLAGALHDVSNALTVLLGWIGEARADDATAESTAYALTIIEQRARLARDLARHAIGSPRIDEQRSAGAIATEVVEQLRVEATKAGATLVVRGGDVAAKVNNSIDVSQVLTNLVMNAIAYAPKGSEVDVEVILDESRCAFVITDQGAGVPESKRDGIFHGESLRPGGTGVGLRHSRALAKANGGDIELEERPSDPTNESGARFRVSWPRVDALPRPPVSAPKVRELTGVRVLLVEDDTAVTQLLETALEGRGADVTIAATKAELTKTLNAGAKFDAALIDLSPISDDPSAALASLRASSPGIDLVLITGSADRLPEGADGETMKLVRKPFELGEVFAALTRKPK